MVRREIYDVDMVGKDDSPNYDNTFTTSILTTDSASFGTIFMLGFGAVLAFVTEFSPKSLIRIGARLLQDFLKSILKGLINVKNFFGNIKKGFVNFWKAIVFISKGLWNFMGAIGDAFKKAYKFLKEPKIKARISKLWDNFKTNYYIKVDKFVVYYEKQMLAIKTKLTDFKVNLATSIDTYQKNMAKNWKLIKNKVTNEYRLFKSMAFNKYSQMTWERTKVYTTFIKSQISQSLSNSFKASGKSLKIGLANLKASIGNSYYKTNTQYLKMWILLLRKLI